jgi:diguanylate cyclase (GGDEF)-like protein
VLTGLYNRRQLEDLDPTGRQFGVLMIDIDHFKRVNDQFGHESGDEVLRRVATAITKSIRPQDLAVRHSGEEFLVVLDEGDDAIDRRIAERIRGAIAAIDAEHLAPDDRITASIGVALHRGRASLAPAVAAADAALYEAKNAGRDQVKLAS